MFTVLPNRKCGVKPGSHRDKDKAKDSESALRPFAVSMPPAKMRFPPETIGWLVGSHIYHTSTAVILNIKLALHQCLGYARICCGS